jgi:hypothetical protein
MHPELPEAWEHPWIPSIAVAEEHTNARCDLVGKLKVNLKAPPSASKKNNERLRASVASDITHEQGILKQSGERICA